MIEPRIFFTKLYPHHTCILFFKIRSGYIAQAKCKLTEFGGRPALVAAKQL